MDADLQTRAASLTYNTVLAIVPVLALIFAVCRGFGFQNLLQDVLYKSFPSQHQLVTTGLKFVDGYLSQASEGVFVGVGLVFLLWTMVSLLSNVEDAFNIIWDVKHGRSLWRKVTDYLAIFLVLPVMMVCGAGISIFMQTTLRTLLPYGFLTPAISLLLDFASVAITWLFYATAYMLIPNAKVRFANALLAGVIAGSSLQILQWLFLSGQLYVAKYNAIYGSFSFLPLFLVWMYLAWLITLIGGVLCYASQNIVSLSFIGQIAAISPAYRRKVTMVVMAVICRRFYAQEKPLSPATIARDYGLPPRLVKDEVSRLINVGVLSRVAGQDTDEEHAVQPAVPVDRLTVGEVIGRLDNYGDSDFIPDFDHRFHDVAALIGKLDEESVGEASRLKFIDLPVSIHPEYSGHRLLRPLRTKNSKKK